MSGTKWPVVLTVLLWAMVGLLVWVMATPEADNATGGPHALVPGMAAGGDGLSRIEPIATAGFLLQVIFQLLVVLLVTMSVPPDRRDLRLWVVLGAIGSALLGTWWQIWSSYVAVLESGVTDYALGFPVSTLWMMLGTWCAGCLFMLLYVFGFRKYVFSEADEAEYERLVASAQEQR